MMMMTMRVLILVVVLFLSSVESLSRTRRRHNNVLDKEKLKFESFLSTVLESDGVRFLYFFTFIDPTTRFTQQLFEDLVNREKDRTSAKDRLYKAISGYFYSKEPMSLLEISSTPAFDPQSGLAEPTPQCRTTMNKWMSECVFGSK